MNPSLRPFGIVPDINKRRSSFIGRPREIFPRLEPKGRKIIFGFSYIQRIGKAASTAVWFPEKVYNALEEFKPEWAAVRQFELLQESGNYDVYPLDVTNLPRAFEYLMKMRAGGYRFAIITLGKYTEKEECDDLRILDVKLQDAIANLISMIYLEEQSAALSSINEDMLKKGEWNYEEALPHVAIAIGAEQLFKPTRSNNSIARFFELLEMLPKENIRHDVAVGLQLPEATSRKMWTYVPPPDEQYTAFHTAFSDVFRGFDNISLGALHERADAGSEVMATMRHMRSYGDHMNENFSGHYRDLASFARNAL